MSTSNAVKSNGLLIAVMLYVIAFGLDVNLGESSSVTRNPNCVTIASSVIDPPPTMPLIQKEHLDDKTYVIKVLINHINALNRHIMASSKSANDVVDKYNKCVGE